MSWPTVSLEEISKSIVYGLNASATIDEHGPRFLRITDIHESSVDWNAVPSCECSEKELEKFRLSSGDIVFARTGATTGKSCLIRNCPTDSVFASYLIRVRLNKKANPEYISHFFQSPIYWAQVRSTAVGAAQPGINATKLKKMQIPLPPIEEQKRIAAILDKANEIEEAVKIIQNKQGDIIRSVFLEIFGDPNLNPMNWDEYTLESLCIEKVGVKAGPFGSSLKKEMYTETGYKIYGQEQVIAESHTIGDYYIPEDVYQRLKSCKVESGDLLISLVGSIGRTLVIPDVFEPGIINPRLLRIRTKRELIHPDFLKILLALPEIQLRLMGSSHGQTMPVLNGRIMKKVSITTPPLSLQKKFLERLDNIDKMLQRTDRMVDASYKLAKSITQELLT